jgi:xanthine dehydrogenase YagS FAD-binding subunit
MKSFEHINARTVDEAIEALGGEKGRAALIAGGTDLLGILKDRILPGYPEVIINIKTISDLAYIKADSRCLKIGALTKLADIAESPRILSAYPGLAQAALSVATPEIRNMGTLGGNLCQQVRCWYYRYPHQLGGRIVCRRKGGRTCPALKGDNRYHAVMGGKACYAVCPSDLAVMLSALEAKLKIAGPEGERSIGAGEFFRPLGNALKPRELLTEVEIPKPPRQSRQTYLKYTLRKPVDFAVVSVASVVTVKKKVCVEASIVLGGIAPGPVRAAKAEAAIRGLAITSATADKAAAAAVEGARPLGKNGYKIEIAQALVKRAIL